MIIAKITPCVIFDNSMLFENKTQKEFPLQHVFIHSMEGAENSDQHCFKSRKLKS